MLNTALPALLVSPQEIAVALAGGLLAVMAMVGAGEIHDRKSAPGPASPGHRASPSAGRR